MVIVLCITVLFATSDLVVPIPLETPPFAYTVNPGHDHVITVLELVECIENAVVDYDVWFESLPGKWPGVVFNNRGICDAVSTDLPPEGIPAVMHTPRKGCYHIHKMINSFDAAIAFYGSVDNRYNVVICPRILVLMDKDTFESTLTLDFLSYFQDHSQTPEGEPSVTFQVLKWAEVDDGVLYVSNAHRTYASMSNESNGYITAIDLNTLEIIWRSRSLVSNSGNFLLLDDVIITGYGFSNEEDFLYVLDRYTGEIVQSVRVPTSPDYLFSHGNSVYVRCYSSDCLFLLK